MPFMHPQIQFKAGFFGTFHFISMNAECVSGMSHDTAENTLQAEMKAYFLATCKY